MIKLSWVDFYDLTVLITLKFSAFWVWQSVLFLAHFISTALFGGLLQPFARTDKPLVAENTDKNAKAI